MRYGVLTGGGDAAGLNAAVRAVTRRLLAGNHEVTGILNGWQGLCGDSAATISLTRREVSGIVQTGGTILGTSRVDPMEHRQTCVDHVAQLELDGIIAIGGDGTLRAAHELHESGFPVVGVPKTIDKDLAGTEYTIGFDTAVHVVTDALDRLHTTAASHHRVMVVEVMGRDVGWVAITAGIAGGADLIVIPEFPLSLNEIAEHLQARKSAGSDFSIVVVAEGAEITDLPVTHVGADPRGYAHSHRNIGEQLAAAIEQHTHFETRATILGYTQRGGTPTAHDRMWATKVGVLAADLAVRKQFGLVAVVRSSRTEPVPIADVIGSRPRVPRELYDIAHVFY